MESKIKINWLWFFTSIFVYPVADLVISIILTALSPNVAEKHFLTGFLGIFVGAFLVVVAGKKSTMWDATLGILLFSILYSILNQNYVFNPLTLFVCLLLGFLGAWLGQLIKDKNK